MNRWVLLVLVLMIIFLVFSVLLALVAKAEDREFPYKNWRIVSVKLMDGIFYIVFENPDKEAEIKAVVIVLLPIDEIPLTGIKPPPQKGLDTAL